MDEQTLTSDAVLGASVPVVPPWRAPSTSTSARLGAGAVLGVAALAIAAWLLRDDHPLPRPASPLGLELGVAATAVMLTNFLYALRKRWGALAGLGRLSSWLDLHVFVGVMSPLLILFHAAYRANNGLARFTYGSLGVVVCTGLIGRYVYGLVPSGSAGEVPDLLDQRERLRIRLAPLLGGLAPLEVLLVEAGAPPSHAPFLSQLLASAPEAVGFRLRLAVWMRVLPAASREEVREGLQRLHRLRQQAGLAGGIKRLMRVWRGLHVTLAILLVVALTAHVGLSAYLGYLPTFRNP
jgi:hypothetical protein